MDAIKSALLYCMEQYGRVERDALFASALLVVGRPLDDRNAFLEVERAYDALLDDGKLAQAEGDGGKTHVYMAGGYA